MCLQNVETVLIDFISRSCVGLIHYKEKERRIAVFTSDCMFSTCLGRQWLKANRFGPLSAEKGYD